LRPLTGATGQCRIFLEASPNAMALLADIRGFVENWLPCFIRDHRAYLTVAIGCTGGQHRSVTSPKRWPPPSANVSRCWCGTAN